jgi:methylmalonyl-CoA carboxyltransferase large subunit
METATDLEALIQELRGELRAMGERMARLEGERAGAVKTSAPPPQPAAAAPEPPPAEEITEEELTAIAAAVAAYLGVRAHIRQVRLVSSRAWAQEGRVSIQASHQLH